MKKTLFLAFSICILCGVAYSGQQEDIADINTKVAQLDLESSTIADVKRIFGKPLKYIWGQSEFAESELPSRYIAVYPRGMSVVIVSDHVHELRFVSKEAGYSHQGKIHIGSSLDEVLEALGQPKETAEGEPIGWKSDVLYRDADGKKGVCYYSSGQHNVRMFFRDYKVVALYLLRSDFGSGGMDSFKTVRAIKSVAKFDDVRWKDMSSLDLSEKAGLIRSLTFNEQSVWPGANKMAAGCDPNKVLVDAMNPGLGVRELHEQGITGKGVNMAIIDQPLYPDHPEFADKIIAYHDVGCESKSSMHGPAVTSLLVGTKCGTAPDARVYYVAAPSWTKDTVYQAKALDWIIEQNKNLSASEKIRVVSVSAAPSGRGSPFEKNLEMWDLACERAEAEGILVLDCTIHRGFIGSCWYDTNDPENVSKCMPGFPGLVPRAPSGRILVPTCPRTTAEQYDKGKFSYQYWGRGGLSWAIPYCAGVLALGWQLNPDIAAKEIRELLFQSAFTKKSLEQIIDPKEFVRLVKKVKTVSVSTSGR